MESFGRVKLEDLISFFVGKVVKLYLGRFVVFVIESKIFYNMFIEMDEKTGIYKLWDLFEVRST